MKTLSKTIAVIGMAVCIAGTSLYAYAESEKNDALAVKSVKISLSEALSSALEKVSGVASEVKFSNDDNQTVWEIEIIDQNQQVHDIEIDANSGAILKNKIDDNDRNDDERDDERNDD